LHPIPHSTGDILYESHGIPPVTIPDVESRNQFGIRVDSAPGPHIAELRIIAGADVHILFADVAPNLVQFQTFAGKIAHRDIHDTGASLSDANAQPHDRIPMNARHALNGANAGAFGQRRDH
jgi:hypothetical protein